MRNQKGITLIALVITIIVLLILASVTINLTLGERGIFSTAQGAAEKAKIAEYTEKIELARAEVASENMGIVPLDKLIEKLYEQKIVPEGSITKLDDYAVMVTSEGHTILITTEKSEYIPGGKIEAPGDINDYIEKGDIIIEQAPGLETYTKESVKITITTKVENQKIQYSIDNGRTYKDYTEAFNVYENKTIYIVLRNALGEIGASYEQNITNIDTEAPVITKVEATPTTIIFSATDNLSGIIGYKVTESETEPQDFEEIANTTSIENKEVSVENQNTTYYVWVKDKAGNVSAYSTAKTGTQPVTSITIAPTSPTIAPGETVELIATINPSNAFNKQVTWNSENTDIATVAQDGTVTAVAAGTATITAVAQDGSNVQGNCTITVKIPTYTITYDSNGGTGAPEAQTEKIGENANISSTQPTKACYTFTGWKVGSTILQPGETYTGTENVTLVAQWSGPTHSYKFTNYDKITFTTGTFKCESGHTTKAEYTLYFTCEGCGNRWTCRERCSCGAWMIEQNDALNNEWGWAEGTTWPLSMTQSAFLSKYGQ